MRLYAALAAIVACASANDFVFLGDDAAAQPAAPAADAEYNKYLEDHKHHAVDLKAVCAAQEKAIEDATEKTATLYGDAIRCFRDKRLEAQGRTAVRSSEEVIAGKSDASDALKACGTTWSASSKTVQDTDTYFTCVVSNNAANKAYPSWVLDKIKAKVPQQTLIENGLKYCVKTKAAFEADKTHENAVKLASCYRGVFKGGSATILIVVVIVLALSIALVVFLWNKSQAPNDEEKDDNYQKNDE